MRDYLVLIVYYSAIPLFIKNTFLSFLQDRAQFQRKFLESDFERPDYGSREKPLALDIKSGSQHIVVFNSLGQNSSPFCHPLFKFLSKF